MPRVTFETYRSRHDQLHQIWTENKELFSYISATKQWEIHGYYLSSDDLSDEELRQHFQAVPIYDSSQPNRAGKVYAELMDQIEIQERLVTQAAAAIPRTPRRRGDASDVSIRVLVKPHVDINALSKIYLALADDVIRQRRGDDGKTDQS
ncbi:hypothetical protein [Arthrobacter sp. STN4]|uniref:hypothetical protein n=1 Tax=Arthrobacter sp. STN4 TaxID=2923276 RepID=UPI00211A45AB|nr:hypothetical protein [Arthrobacter sp. STN4]MCQ9163105.1 hypothetical protein [Arthrobacter sp. STN4]